MRRWLLLLPMAGFVSSAAIPLASAEPACSSGRVLGVRAPLFILATAGRDTVRAGPGTVRYHREDERAADLASIHGQRFRLDRIGGDVPAALAGAAGGDVVLVPHGGQCGEVWSWDQARWAKPGRQVFIDAVLRPRAQWADGTPTFDVDLSHDLYPEAYPGFDPDADKILTVAEMFALNRALPTWEQQETTPMEAYRPLLAWVRENPRLAERFPAEYTLDFARGVLQPCVPAHDPHPVAGTYAVRVVLDGADTLRTFFRTDARGSVSCAPQALRLDLDSVTPRLADTAHLTVRGAATVAGIADSAAPWPARPDCSGVGSPSSTAPRSSAAASAAGGRS